MDSKKNKINGKKFVLLYVFFYILLLLIGIIVCLLVDTYTTERHFRVTFGFLFTIPFTSIILAGTLFSQEYFFNRSEQFGFSKKIKILIVGFSFSKWFFYIFPILTGCLLNFFQKNDCVFNIFSIFAGIILLWIASIIAHVILFERDLRKMLRAEGERSNVATGDSLRTN